MKSARDAAKFAGDVPHATYIKRTDASTPRGPSRRRLPPRRGPHARPTKANVARRSGSGRPQGSVRRVAVAAAAARARRGSETGSKSAPSTADAPRPPRAKYARRGGRPRQVLLETGCGRRVDSAAPRATCRLRCPRARGRDRSARPLHRILARVVMTARAARACSPRPGRASGASRSRPPTVDGRPTSAGGRANALARGAPSGAVAAPTSPSVTSPPRPPFAFSAPVTRILFPSAAPACGRPALTISSGVRQKKVDRASKPIFEPPYVAASCSFRLLFSPSPEGSMPARGWERWYVRAVRFLRLFPGLQSQPG